MGKRSTSVVVGIKTQTAAEKTALARAMRRHLERAEGYDGARFRAQTYEVDAIDTLYALMTDPNTSPALRRACALDLRMIARGPIAPQLHDGQTINPAEEAPDQPGSSVGDVLEAARVSADTLRRVQDLVQKRVPWTEWPPELQLAVGEEMGAAFAEE